MSDGVIELNRQSSLTKKNLFKIFRIACLLISLIFLIQGALDYPESPKKLFKGLQLCGGCLFIYLPLLIEKRFKIVIPGQLYFMYLFFIFSSVFLGTGFSFYSKVPYWDKFLHFISAGFLVLMGIVLISSDSAKKEATRLPLQMILVFGVLFAIVMGVFWEFYEYLFDGLLGLNMQRYLGPKGVVLVGREALKDTMGDLLVDVLGAVLTGCYCWLVHVKKPNWLEQYKIKKS